MLSNVFRPKPSTVNRPLKAIASRAVAFCFGRARLLASAIPPVKKAFPYSSTEKAPRPTEGLVIRSGNLATKTDAKGQQIQYAYDAAQRLTGVSYFTTAGDTTPVKTVSFSYDAVGNLTGYNDGTSSATYVYDPLGRKTSEAVNYGGFTKTFSYAYDNANQKTSVTYPDGTTYAVDYAKDGSLSSMNIPGVGALSMTEDRGRPAGRIFPGGATRTTPMDAYGRPTAITANDPGGNPLLALPFTFDKNDNVKTKGPTQYDYDNTDQLKGVQDPAKPTEAFGYDAVGNRQTHAQGINVTTAAFNENNELETSGDVAYAYDLNGNMTAKVENGSTTTYTYDVDNRLVQVTNSSSSLTAVYTYDPFGHRLSKTVNGATTFFEYADEGLIAEMISDGTITKTYGWEPSGIWETDPLWMHVLNSTTEPTGYFWYENDYIGSPVKMTDTSGAVVWAAVYDTFGAATVDPASTIVNNLRFPGQYFDGETVLHYNNQRYYDPINSRYMQIDPARFKQIEDNQFLYTGNNPTTYFDFNGLFRYSKTARWMHPFDPIKDQEIINAIRCLENKLNRYYHPDQCASLENIQLIVTEARRTEAENQQLMREGIDASPTSKHLVGRAFDFRRLGYIPSILIRRLARDCGFGYVTNAYADGHYHMTLRGKP
jgi:RHS repeat-associated protein